MSRTSQRKGALSIYATTEFLTKITFVEFIAFIELNLEEVQKKGGCQQYPMSDKKI